MHELYSKCLEAAVTRALHRLVVKSQDVLASAIKIHRLELAASMLVCCKTQVKLVHAEVSLRLTCLADFVTQHCWSEKTDTHSQPVGSELLPRSMPQ